MKVIQIGTASGRRSADDLRVAFDEVNENFAELDELGVFDTPEIIESDTIEPVVSDGTVSFSVKPEAVRVVGEVVPFTDTGALNNYNPDGLDDIDVFVYTGAGAVISGMYAPSVPGKFKSFHNGGTGILIFSHESSLSSATRQFSNPGKTWVFAMPGDTITWFYFEGKYRYFCGVGGQQMNLPFFTDFLTAAGFTVTNNGQAAAAGTANTAAAWSRFEQGAVSLDTGSTSTGGVWVGSGTGLTLAPTKGASLVVAKVSVTTLATGSETYGAKVGYSNEVNATTWNTGVGHEIGWDGSVMWGHTSYPWSSYEASGSYSASNDFFARAEYRHPFQIS
jgi:hypothetical protein